MKRYVICAQDRPLSRAYLQPTGARYSYGPLRTARRFATIAEAEIERCDDNEFVKITDGAE